MILQIVLELGLDFADMFFFVLAPHDISLPCPLYSAFAMLFVSCPVDACGC